MFEPVSSSSSASLALPLRMSILNQKWKPPEQPEQPERSSLPREEKPKLSRELKPSRVRETATTTLENDVNV